MSEKNRILIVDDDKGTHRTLSLILRRKGYEVDVAETGREAVEKAQERFFNVALIDIRLPDISGIEVLKTFRRKYPSRMNVMITGNATVKNSIEALNLGANAYIEKPIDSEELDRMIKESKPNGTDKKGTFGFNPLSVRIKKIEDEK